MIILCYVVGAFALWISIRKHKKSRQVQDTPRSKLGSAPQGLVEIQGFAWPNGEPFLTPEGKDVVYYYFQLQRKETRGSGKNKSTVWVPVHFFAHCPPFYVVDPSGLALIHGSGCELNISSARTRGWQQLNKKVQSHIHHHIVKDAVPGFPPSRFLFGLFSTSYQIVEQEICIGSPLYASGDFRSDAEIQAKAKEPGLTLFSKTVFDEERGTIRDVNHLRDKNGDKKISETEHITCYIHAGNLARKKTIEKA